MATLFYREKGVLILKIDLLYIGVYSLNELPRPEGRGMYSPPIGRY
jgi:hypothetical protein